MKEVKAYIKKMKENDVINALHKLDGLTGVTMFDVSKGFGMENPEIIPEKIINHTREYTPHVKIEIVCKDYLVEKVIQAIQQSAHTGLRQDGKIYVSTIEDAIRIASNERGDSAC